MKTLLMLLMAASVVCVAGTAEAKKKAKTFAQLDKNKDGKIAKDEFVFIKKAAGKKAQTKQFAALDKNKDGFLDSTEYTK